MENQDLKGIGCLGICAYFLFGVGIISFLFNTIQGEHRDEYGDWISSDDITNTALYTLGVGIVLYLIDRIRHRE